MCRSGATARGSLSDGRARVFGPQHSVAEPEDLATARELFADKGLHTGFIIGADLPNEVQTVLVGSTVKRPRQASHRSADRAVHIGMARSHRLARERRQIAATVVHVQDIKRTKQAGNAPGIGSWHTEHMHEVLDQSQIGPRRNRITPTRPQTEDRRHQLRGTSDQVPGVFSPVSGFASHPQQGETVAQPLHGVTFARKHPKHVEHAIVDALTRPEIVAERNELAGAGEMVLQEKKSDLFWVLEGEVGDGMPNVRHALYGVDLRGAKLKGVDLYKATLWELTFKKPT